MCQETFTEILKVIPVLKRQELNITELILTQKNKHVHYQRNSIIFLMIMFGGVVKHRNKIINTKMLKTRRYSRLLASPQKSNIETKQPQASLDKDIHIHICVARVYTHVSHPLNAQHK